MYVLFYYKWRWFATESYIYNTQSGQWYITLDKIIIKHTDTVCLPSLGNKLHNLFNNLNNFAQIYQSYLSSNVVFFLMKPNNPFLHNHFHLCLTSSSMQYIFSWCKHNCWISNKWLFSYFLNSVPHHNQFSLQSFISLDTCINKGATDKQIREETEVLLSQL